MTTNHDHTPAAVLKPAPKSTAMSNVAKRGPVMVLRAGALDYRTYPSLAGGERLAYKSGAHLGGE